MHVVKSWLYLLGAYIPNLIANCSLRNACLGGNIFSDVLYIRLHACPASFTSSRLKNNYTTTKLGHVPNPFDIFVVIDVAIDEIAFYK